MRHAWWISAEPRKESCRSRKDQNECPSRESKYLWRACWLKLPKCGMPSVSRGEVSISSYQSTSISEGATSERANARVRPCSSNQ